LKAWSLNIHASEIRHFSKNQAKILKKEGKKVFLLNLRDLKGLQNRLSGQLKACQDKKKEQKSTPRLSLGKGPITKGLG